MGDGMEGVGGDGYSFASEPRAVSSRKKARDLQSPGGPSPGQGGEERLAINIMWDRRVVRGSTRPGTQGSQQPEPMQSPAPSGRNSSAMQRGPQLSRSRDRSRRSQRGAPGRHEAPVWVPAEPLPESMYEEILDRPIDIYEASTDKGNSDRPPSPIFIPQAQGVDAGTQVEDDDLFDFDTEVEPIIERVVGSTLQQALMECDEEDMVFEESMRMADWEVVRAVELSEAQRREVAEERRNLERDRRQEQLEARDDVAARATRQVAARGMSHEYVGEVLGEVFSSLDTEGFFPDPLAIEIEETFLPWLLDGVATQIEELIEDGRRAEQRVLGALLLRQDKLTAATVFYEKEVALIAARKAAEQRLVALAAATEAMQGEEAA